MGSQNPHMEALTRGTASMGVSGPNPGEEGVHRVEWEGVSTEWKCGMAGTERW